MRFLEGKSLAEIGQTLNLSVDAVAKRAMRSILKLSEFAVELGLRDSH
jgi:DNA-directed RNA polymerase specialized sigma24 family protein